jgi:hypothetical protein
MPPTRPAADRDGRPPVPYVVAFVLAAGVVLFGTWVALVGQSDLQDDVAGGVAAVIGVFAGWMVSDKGRAIPQFRFADIKRIVGFGPQLATQTIGIYAATWRRVRCGQGSSGMRTVTTDVGGGGWRAARRSAVVGALLSFTPDTIVIDIDAETGLATVHDFVAEGPTCPPS